MLAVDTNVVLRLLVRDDPAQTARVYALFKENSVFVPVSVMLETEWVLRTVYNTDRSLIFKRLQWFAGLSQVTVQNDQAVATAIRWAAAGLEFADALHLATTDPCDAFVTFDRAFIRKAARLQLIPMRSP